MKKILLSVFATVIAMLSLIYVNESASVSLGGIRHTQPTIANATSVTCLAANPNRKFLMIQNLSSSDFYFNLNGEAIGSLTPGDTVRFFKLVAGAGFVLDTFVTPSAITCRQESGGSIRTISFAEGNN